MKEARDTTRHVPVLKTEVIEALALAPGKIVVDATLGGGGHAQAILQEVLSTGALIAIDTDEQAIRRFETVVEKDRQLQQAYQEKKLRLVQKNYSELRSVLHQEGIDQVDAILADLGFSSDQIESAERGLSFQEDGPLDMRLNQQEPLTAEKIVNTYSVEELTRILRMYGDEVMAGKIAHAIEKRREEAPLRTTRELRELIEEVYPKKQRFAQKIHPATKTFQALRIAVNREYEHLEQFLKDSMNALKPGGRLVIITFHSGEDRIVKQFFREQATGCVCPPEFPVCRCGQVPQLRILTKKPIIASEEEKKVNPRARSAKVRVAEKV